MTILNDVLDHSKVEAGKLTLARAPLSLLALTTSVVGLFRGNAQAKGLELRIDVEHAGADRVFGDAQRLKQVLLNLVGNAIKFTERGSVTLRMRADAQEGEPAGDRARVLFEVVDTGIGIAPEAMRRLFQPFHQIDGARNRRHGGTGLGLAISQRIVETMGGSVEVVSSPGHGSNFHFSVAFERDRSEPAPAQPDSALGALDGLVQPSGTVLVVEDNAVNRMIALQMLRSLDLEVLEAENGSQALDRLQESAVELVMMDIQMPVMDGYVTAKSIRAREAALGLPRMPIIALTANAFDEDVAQAMAAGMDGHLAKPYTRAQLREVVATWM